MTDDMSKSVFNSIIKDKSDNLLLHITSLNGVLFIFFQIFIGGTKAILLFIPLTIFVIVLPIYIGYIRGALFLDSNIERIRGWIYLISGTMMYIINIGYIALKNFSINGIPSIWILPFILSICTGIITIYLWYKLKIMYRENLIMPIEPKIYYRTSTGATSLAIALSLIVILIYEGFSNVEFFSFVFLYTLPLFIVFFYFEYENRCDIKKINDGDLNKFRKDESQKKYRTVIRIIILSMLIISSIFLFQNLNEGNIRRIIVTGIMGFILPFLYLSGD